MSVQAFKGWCSQAHLLGPLCLISEEGREDNVETLGLGGGRAPC